MHKGIHDYMKITDLKDMLKKVEEKYSNEEAFKFKTDVPGKFDVITYKQFISEVNALGTAFIDLGLKDKKIAVISENRYEWGLTYLATVCGTGLIVPLDRALPENEIRSLIERSEVDVIVYSKKYDDIMERVRNDKISKIKYYISMDDNGSDNVLSLKELISKGKKLLDDGNREFIDAKIDAEKMSIMLFTSGTTSKSKAVALSHKNICTNIQDIASMFDINKDDTFLSFLPLHHTFESTVGFLYPVYAGGCIAYCDGIKHLAENIREYQITAMISVPILYESMYKKVIRGIKKQGKYENFQKGLKISNFLRKYLHIDLRRKIFKDIHELLGGKVRLFINGAAALDPEVEKGFNDIGINMAQGYGLTETSPVLAAGNGYPKYSRNGSVGRAFPSVELKIEDPDENGIGEVIAKADSVMLGYYGNEEATKEAIVDGWFHTGDLGYFDKDEFLYITGRKKTVIVLKNGKNIYPEEIEALIGRIDGVKESFVYGVSGNNADEKESKINAEIVYDVERIKEILKTTDEEKIKDYMWEHVKEINKTMPPYKYIREIIVTDEELIKTTTQKVKRHEEIKKVLGK